jgi:4-amino-4-deoxy-L-arabinose transferase-like glycosyltransferase
MSSPSTEISTFRRHLPGLIAMGVVLIVYGILSFLRHSDQLIWDEGRYVLYAKNLTQGFYVDSADPDFVSGPGYSILLMPFCWSTQGWLVARLLNAVLMAGAVGFVWLTLRHYISAGWAAFAAWIVGLHPTLLWMSFSLMTEPLSMFCITGFMWSFCHAMRTGGWRWIIAAALFLGWATLTRVFFGHVIMACTVMALLLLFIRDWRPQLRRALLILAGAFLLCTPYLFHTWQKTGQVLCWSTNSGELLYWMCSANEGENGQWFRYSDTRLHPDLAKNHAVFFENALKQTAVEREALFKEAAMANFKAHPMKVGYNWLCNLSRLAFGFPRSFEPEELRTVVLILMNGPIILLAALMGLIGLWRWRRVPMEIWFLMGFTAFYLGGGSLAPSVPRYFVIVYPMLILGAFTVWKNTFVCQLKPISKS